MSNNEKDLRKSLGISEYPWSSDDDGDDGTESRNASSSQAHRHGDDTLSDDINILGNNEASSSQAGPSSSQSEDAKKRAILERDFYWNYLNNPSMNFESPSSSSVNDPVLCEAARPIHVSMSVVREARERRTYDPNLRQIVAIKKLTKHMKDIRKAKPGSFLFSPLRKRPGTSSEPTQSSSGMFQPASADTRSSDTVNITDQSDDDIEPNPGINPSTTEDNTEQHGNDVNSYNSSVEHMSLEDEMVDIVEVDSEPQDERQDSVNKRGAEQVNGVAVQNNNNNAEKDTDNGAAQDAVAGQSTEQNQNAKAAKDDEVLPTTVKELNQNLLSLLECPVCLESIEPPMSQCRRGHLVCARCRQRLTACPVCRTGFSSVRNRGMEAVAELVQFPCRHGCGREVRLRRRVSHEASCGARKFRCVAPACSLRTGLSRAELAQHLATKHPTIMKVGPKHKFSVKVNAEVRESWVFKVKKELFHAQVAVDVRAWSVVIHVSYIGPKCKAKSYIYEVTMLGHHNARRLVYSRTTHSDLDSSTLTVSRQDCFHMNLDQAINFIRVKNRSYDMEKFLEFYISIQKNESHVKTEIKS